MVPWGSLADLPAQLLPKLSWESSLPTVLSKVIDQQSGPRTVGSDPRTGDLLALISPPPVCCVGSVRKAEMISEVPAFKMEFSGKQVLLEEISREQTWGLSCCVSLSICC